MKDNKKELNVKSVVMIVVFVAVVGIIGALLSKLGDKNVQVKSESVAPQMEANLVLGSSSKSLDEQIAEAQRKVDEGSIGIKMATAVQMNVGNTTAKVLIENPARNTKSFVVSIQLEDGEEIYTSGLIPPNSYLETVDFKRELGEGVYPAVAYFTTYTPEGVEDGQAGIAITINVQN